MCGQWFVTASGQFLVAAHTALGATGPQRWVEVGASERDQCRRCKASPTAGENGGGARRLGSGRMSAPRSTNVGPGPYARHVANASPSPTPNPDAMKFTLDTTLPEKLGVTSPDAAVGVPFAEAVFSAGGVASIYGVNDFVTVRRQPGDDWGPIVAVVVAAAAAHL
jgi:hypothetical protein